LGTIWKASVDFLFPANGGARRRRLVEQVEGQKQGGSDQLGIGFELGLDAVV
jgi:hypothetical protein